MWKTKQKQTPSFEIKIYVLLYGSQNMWVTFFQHKANFFIIYVGT